MSSENPFSTDEALVSAWDPSNKIEDYLAINSYEDHPLYDEDKDLAALSTRIRGQQVSAVEWLANNQGYYKTGAMRLAWMRGIDVLDDSALTDTWKDFRSYKLAAEWVVQEYQHDALSHNSKDMICTLQDVENPYEHDPGLDKTGPRDDIVTFKVIPEQKSRINTRFRDYMNFGAWFHSALIDLGLSGSDRLPRSHVHIPNQAVGVIRRLVNRQSRQVNEILGRYLSRNVNYWADNGVHDDVLDDIHAIVGYGCQGGRKMVQNEVNRIRDSRDFEIIPADEHEYRSWQETNYFDVDK